MKPTRFKPRLVTLVASMGAMLHGVIFRHMARSGLIACLDDAALMKSLDGIEARIAAFTEKAEGELKTLGKISEDTKTALENFGTEQRELADRLLKLEQKSKATGDTEPKPEDGYGEQFVKSQTYEGFLKSEARGRVRMELKNTVTNPIANTFSQRRPDLIEGPARVFTIEDQLTQIPTTAPSVDWIRENVFTNNAAETAEGAAKPQSSLTFTPGTMPITTVAHWIKITRQLAMDNAALAAYINRRMAYGVNLRVENQLLIGNGVAPNINGLLNAGNFTAHGYTAATLTAAGMLNNRFDLIGKMMGDAALADYPADTVILNTGDYWTMRLAKDTQNRYLLGDPGSGAVPGFFGARAIPSNAMPAGNVWVGNLAGAATEWIREGLTVEMFDQDENNAQLNLITIRAERRLALTVERPAAARYGALVPA